jgi:MoaA/NifB/PqqE/SkfB family radical SAM enzyme
MCDIWKNKSQNYVSVNTVLAWLIQLRKFSIRKIIICGEPLLHPQLWDICSAIHDQGIRIELLTNGFLVERHIESILRYVNELRVSLDGPEQIHNYIRGYPNAYQKLKSSVFTLRKFSPDFDIGGRCAVHRYNFRHLRATVEAAYDIGLTNISFSATDVYNEEAFKRYGQIDERYKRNFILTQDDVDNLETEINLLESKFSNSFANGFISDSPEDLRRLLRDFYLSMLGKCEKLSVVCNAPWTSAVIEYDGCIRPCFPMSSYGQLTPSTTVEEILNGTDAIQFRESLDVNQNNICRNCVCQTVIHPD